MIWFSFMINLKLSVDVFYVVGIDEFEFDYVYELMMDV